jgi:uncharacterized membrane protein YqaE (UPF0057 family)/PBP1b-binding outer membrane lipoprotein LpoB
MTRVITILMASLLLVGCSNKGFHKRQYKNRMWINHGFTKKETKSVDKSPHLAEESPTKLKKLDLEFEDLEIKSEAPQKSVERKPKVSPQQKLKKEPNTAIIVEEQRDNGPYTVQNAEITQAQFKQVDKKDGHHVDHSGIAILLLVVIALIIPPLAVLLYEGATNRFLVNLLLSLLYLLVFVNPIAALCGLLAVIHAILIVIGAI